MSQSKVLVFGPTGNVGSSCALAAAKKGAHVVLAMRDTAKATPGLENMERTQADLVDPASLKKAVDATGATKAFIYFAHQSRDGMMSSTQALKNAGVEFVVFLSSRDVPRKAEDSKPDDLLAIVHAQVELNLRKVFGENGYAAVRPGAFATNLLRYKDDILAGKELGVYRPEAIEDHITPTDIGIVAGTILAKGLQSEKREVYIFGPQLLSTGSALETVGKVLGKDVKVKALTAEEGIEHHVHQGIPKPIAVYLQRTTREAANSGRMFRSEMYEEGVKNVNLYKGSPAEGLEEWAKANKEMIMS